VQTGVFDAAGARFGDLARERRRTVSRALADAQRRLGRLILSQDPNGLSGQVDALVVDDLQGRAKLMALKIRDLSGELGSARVEGSVPVTPGL